MSKCNYNHKVRISKRHNIRIQIDCKNCGILHLNDGLYYEVPHRKENKYKTKIITKQGLCLHCLIQEYINNMERG